MIFFRLWNKKRRTWRLSEDTHKFLGWRPSLRSFGEASTNNFPRAGIAEPSLSSNVSLDIPGDCAVCTYVRGGNGLKHGKQFTIFLLHIRKVKYMTLIVQRLGRKDANLFPVFAFRMLPSSADMRHVPRSEGQECWAALVECADACIVLPPTRPVCHPWPWQPGEMGSRNVPQTGRSRGCYSGNRVDHNCICRYMTEMVDSWC